MINHHEARNFIVFPEIIPLHHKSKQIDQKMKYLLLSCFLFLACFGNVASFQSLKPRCGMKLVPKAICSQKQLKLSANNQDAADIAKMWDKHFENNSNLKYQVIAAPGMENMGKNMMNTFPARFLFHETQWKKFPDGTDRIEIGGFHPTNRISGQHVLMLASFHNNDVTLSQFSVMVTLLQSFIKSLTVVLPYYPVGTMERVIQEGQVATANSYAQMFSNLPSCGKPTRLVIYDLHTLQNRFYLHNNAIASLQTSIPLLINKLASSSSEIDCIAFPDDGANKRICINVCQSWLSHCDLWQDPQRK